MNSDQLFAELDRRLSSRLGVLAYHGVVALLVLSEVAWAARWWRS